MKLKSPIAALLAWSMCLSLFPTSNVYPATLGSEKGFVENMDDEDDTDDKGLRFRLSEGAEQAAPITRDTVAPAVRLSDVEANKILARLPDLKTETTDTQDFKLRERSTPAPRTGATIDAAFDVPTLNVAPPVMSNANTALEVTRFQPTGEVALAPALSVTFSQPMVSIASQREASSVVPVQLSPEVKGAWRWLGTQTIVFQPEANKTEANVDAGVGDAPNEANARLPMATNYRVTIPAGTKSAGGNVLNQVVSFTFATPPPTIVKSYPEGESNARDRLMFLEFDQQIDANKIIELLKLQNSNARPSHVTARLRLATEEEIAGDDAVKELVRNAVPNRWLAFRAVSPNNETTNALPSDANVKIVIPAGTPSMEGARVTTKEQSFAFKTFGALRVSETACGYDKRCSPFDTFRIEFNNQIDTESFDKKQVVISPALPNAKITAAYNSITIEAAKRSNTIYTVTLDRNLKDTYGQTLTGKNQVTFKVTNASPALFTTSENFTVLDPAGRKAFTVYSVNYRQMKVRLYKVTPDDWQRFHRYQSAKAAPPGKLVFDKVIDVRTKADELTETSLDLSPALTDGYGQVFVKVEAIDLPKDKNAPIEVYAYGGRRNRAEAWVQVTNIGLDAFADKKEIVAWANSLKDGAPLAGVEVSIVPDNLKGTTEANGLTRLDFKPIAENKENQMPLLVAKLGNDLAILPHSYYNQYNYGNESRSWRNYDSSESFKGYVFDDRKLYRPGEEVNIKGWIRKVDLTPQGDTEMFDVAGEIVAYVVSDSQDNEIAKGDVKLNALAGFNLKLKLPATMNLGEASIEFKPNFYDFIHTHAFQVQEFRRPEFEVTAKTSEAPHFVGASATATMTASYFAGGGLADTEVEWNVRARPTNYTPPNRDDYTFGKFIAWWRDDENDDETTEREFKSRTDAAGKHSLKMDFDAVNPARPSSVTAEAKIQDVNRQTFAATTAMLVHPADVYVGVRSNRTFVQAGQAFEIESIVTDLDGRAEGNREVALRLVRLDYVFEKGEWKRKETGAQEQTIRSAGDGVKTRFNPKQGGEYRLTARVRDGRGRANESELSLWVAGGKLPPQREVEQEEIELIPNRKTYAGGEVAEILVQSPFAPAEGVVTLRRSGLLRTERFSMNENSYTLRVPLEEAMTPNVHLQVDLVGAAWRVDDAGNVQSDLPKRPAFASGEIKLEIPPVTRRLNVKASPRATTLEPGAETMVDVEVKDANGRSVEGTDTALVVVDESVLALTNYKLRDPLSVFYAERDEDTSDYHLREKVELASAEDVRRLASSVGSGVGYGAGGGGAVSEEVTVTARELTELPLNTRSRMDYLEAEETSSSTASMGKLPARPMPDESQEEIKIRQNFNALAVFAASFPTDKNGRANIKVKLPDNLTRYRVMAVSVAGGKLFGTGEAAITARQPLMVRPSLPRFLNFGDRAELPVIVQNQSDEPVRVNVAVRASNADLTEGAGRRVTVPANDRVEVRFPVAAVKPGTARFQFVAASNLKSDAAEISLPVYTPATTEAFATYGTIDEGDEGAIRQAVKAPADAVKTFGGLEITLASTQLQELTDAVIYLYRYPFECSEQLASRIISIVALKDVLAAFKTKDLPGANEMRASVNQDLQRLAGLQNEDSGFDFWQRGRVSNPFVSVHVAHSLARAKAAGFIVSPEMIKSAQSYLKNIESKIPKTYSLKSRQAIIAYALYVRALMNDRDAARARKLIAEAGGVEKLSLESLGWLLPVLASDKSSAVQVESIRRHLNNRVTETAGAAHFADDYTDGEYTILHSNRRADGVLLDALIGDQPQSDLIPKLVRGLLGNRTRGRWTNTQENVFALLALNRYFQTYERTTPDFTARVWLGDGYAGAQTFQGRTAERQRLNLPMTQLIERTAKGAENLIIGKQGAGRLYFRVGTTYAPSNLKLDAADYGFQIERTYEAVDDKTDVTRDGEGTWRVKAGARVRVRLKLINPSRRYHVALVDNLPAGFESLNPALATTERLPEEKPEASVFVGGRGVTNNYYLWRGTWYEHQNLRDERAEAFTSLLWEGVHEYSYFIRATTPGVFVVPPAKAEEMYSPETFGRGASDRVRVE